MRILRKNNINKYIKNNGKQLDVSHLCFDEIEYFPPNLEIIICGGNLFTELPPLPSNLRELYCNNNFIKKLPPLPKTLKRLDCDDNQLKELPILPDVLKVLVCHSNYLPEFYNVYENDYNTIEEIKIMQKKYYRKEKIKKIF